MSGARHPHGFTLIELLAATALTGLLMVAVLSVTASLGEPRRVIGASQASPPWQSAALALLEQDLLMARRIEAVEGELVIEGQLELIGPALAQRHRPVQVRYGLDRDTGLFVRKQRNLLDERTQTTQRALVLAGVRAVSFEVLRFDAEREAMEPVSPEANDAGTIPVAVRVELAMEDGSMLRRTIRLR